VVSSVSANGLVILTLLDSAELALSVVIVVCKDGTNLAAEVVTRLLAAFETLATLATLASGLDTGVLVALILLAVKLNASGV